jgi:ligand-binding SRPBCC domain-containing protein
MSLYTLRCSLKTPVAVEEAFRVFKDQNNLARITPPWMNFRILTPDTVIAKGAEIEYRMACFGIPFGWKTLIEEYEPPFYFVDVQLAGPYRSWRHRHTFHPSDSGAIVADEVVYSLPFGPLGRLANAVAVSRQLRAIFRYRQQAIGALLGGSVEVDPPRIVRGAPSPETEQQLAHQGSDRRH